MADRDVIQALRAIKALALQHHGDEPPATLLHALLVEIPAECDSAIAALDAAGARPTPPAPDAGAMRELDALALLIAKAHGALFIDGGPGSVAFRADLNAARALTHDAYEKIESVRAAIRALPPAPVDAVERDAARFRWLMERNFGFAFDAERCGISTGRWGRWPEEPDEQRAMIDRAIAAEASAGRDGKGE